MNEYRRQSAFLQSLLAYDDSASSHELRERLAAAERNERSLLSACRLVSFFGLFGLFAFGYSAVLVPEFFENSSHLLIRLSSALGLGSVMCLMVFLGLWLWYRAVANRVREECRQSVRQTLDAVLSPQADRGRPVVLHSPHLTVYRKAPPVQPSGQPQPGNAASAPPEGYRKAS